MRDQLPVRRLAEQLTDRGATLAVAESCTGGLLGGRLTEGEGASSFFVAGLTTYSNRAKTDLLGVPADIIAEKGAVSEEVARLMAEGARSRLDATYALSVTGIAGPGGGTALKPVGTVWIAAAGPQETVARRHLFEGDREAVRAAAVEEALNMLEAMLAREG